MISMIYYFLVFLDLVCAIDNDILESIFITNEGVSRPSKVLGRTFNDKLSVGSVQR